MSKIMRSMTSSSIRYGGSRDISVNRESRSTSSDTGYGRIGPDGTYEAASPSYPFRVSRRLRIPKLERSTRENNGKEPSPSPSSTFLGRLRVAYERLMLKAGSPTGAPVAKNERAPSAVTAAVSTWIVSGSRKGAKIRDLDPGFKLSAAEKKYLQHLTRTASVR